MLIALLLVFIICPVLPSLPATHWAMRFFDFVRVQTLVLQIIIIVICGIYWQSLTMVAHILVICVLAVLIYQIILIAPYTPFYKRRKPKQSFHNEQFTLVTANVLQTNKNFSQFIDLIRESQPDLFITMESDEHWDKELSKAFPEYKYTLKATLDNFYGMHMYSKLPFKKAQIQYLVEEDIPSMHCELDFADQIFNIVSIHPAPPSPTENETSRERDAELMIVGKKCRESVDATVVCGDLNDVVWSRTSRLFKKMTGFLDPRVGRGLYPSFHANIWLLRFPLDHLFYSRDLHVTEMKRLAPFGSDHFAMYYKIVFPIKNIEVPNPEISSEERDEIREIIKEGKLAAQE